MWYPAAITTPAISEPITLDEAKAQTRINFSDDDDYLGTLIAAGRDHVERYCNTRLATQTVVAKCDGFGDLSRLPEAPVQSVTSIAYIDVAGATQILPDTVYELRTDGLEAAITRKYGQEWPAIQPGSRITVTAVVGYTAAPPAVKHAILLWLSDAYEQRENAAAGPWTALDALLSNFRRGA